MSLKTDYKDRTALKRAAVPGAGCEFVMIDMKPSSVVRLSLELDTKNERLRTVE